MARWFVTTCGIPLNKKQFNYGKLYRRGSGADCKSVVLDSSGSTPLLPTKYVGSCSKVATGSPKSRAIGSIPIAYAKFSILTG